MTGTQMENLAKDFAHVINKNSLERECNTPDFVIGIYLAHCFVLFASAVVSRDKAVFGEQSEQEWRHTFEMSPGFKEQEK